MIELMGRKIALVRVAGNVRRVILDSMENKNGTLCQHEHCISKCSA